MTSRDEGNLTILNDKVSRDRADRANHTCKLLTGPNGHHRSKYQNFVSKRSIKYKNSTDKKCGIQGPIKEIDSDEQFPVGKNSLGRLECSRKCRNMNSVLALNERNQNGRLKKMNNVLSITVEVGVNVNA